MIHTRDNNRSGGFTLIELMIAVAVVAIIAAFAFPSYQVQIRKSARSAAQAFLMDVAARQQQRFVDVRTYASTLASLGMTPSDKVDTRYTIAVATGAGPPPTFTLTATPKAIQTADSCGTLTVDNTGTRTPANCW